MRSTKVIKNPSKTMPLGIRERYNDIGWIRLCLNVNKSPAGLFSKFLPNTQKICPEKEVDEEVVLAF